MTTSGTTIYQLSRNDIVTAALRKLGVLAAGQSPSAEDYTNGSMSLNTLVAEFRAKGMPLWARKTFSFTPTVSVGTYEIGIGKTFNVAYPIHVLQAYRQDSGSTTKIEMQIIPNYNYNLYPTSVGGTPIQLNYQPLNNYGKINIWPIPDTSATTSTITIIYQAPFEYFISGTDTPDFPEEWYNALIYNLAVLLAPEWGVPLADRQMLNKEAMLHLENALENGPEDGSLFLQPQRQMVK